MRGLSWHHRNPLPPRDVLKVGRADTRGLPGHLPVLLPTTMACSYPRWLRPWRHAKQEHFAQRPDVIGQPRGHRWGPRLPQLGRARPIGGLGLREGLAQTAMGQDEIVIHLEEHQLLTQSVFALTRRGAAAPHRRYPLPQT